jgi:hypothetical protein
MLNDNVRRIEVLDKKTSEVFTRGTITKVEMAYLYCLRVQIPPVFLGPFEIVSGRFRSSLQPERHDLVGEDLEVHSIHAITHV